MTRAMDNDEIGNGHENSYFNLLARLEWDHPQRLRAYVAAALHQSGLVSKRFFAKLRTPNA